MCVVTLWGQSHKLAKPDTFPGAVVSEATEPAKRKNGSLLLCFVIFTILFGGQRTILEEGWTRAWVEVYFLTRFTIRSIWAKKVAYSRFEYHLYIDIVVEINSAMTHRDSSTWQATTRTPGLNLLKIIPTLNQL